MFYIILRLVVNVFDGNVQLYVLSHLPNNFHCVAKIVLDGLSKSSRVDFVTEVCKESSIFGSN